MRIGFLGSELPHTTAAQFESAATILFGQRLLEFLALYPDSPLALLSASSDAFIGDIIIKEQTWEVAYLQQQTSCSDVFLYYYNYTSIYSPIPAHTAEEPFCVWESDQYAGYSLYPGP